MHSGGSLGRERRGGGRRGFYSAIADKGVRRILRLDFAFGFFGFCLGEGKGVVKGL